MNKFIRNITLIIVMVLAGVLPGLSGCSKTAHEGFAIYLVKGDVPPSQMQALSHVDIIGNPVIGIKDIITYNAQTHEIKLSGSAFDRITQLDVPVRGRSFVVCIDKSPIYWGAFWTPISSMSFDGVTIWKPFNSQVAKIVTLELGYPAQSFYGGEDPRNNPVVIKSLERSGKLIRTLSISAVTQLPNSMKGYELYSWSEDGQWHFTLITGTNRNKTVEEIVSNQEFISEAGWVNIHVVGVDALKMVLSKLPQKESVFWLGGMRSEQSANGGPEITIPAEPIVNIIKEYSAERGLELVAPGH
jgi:hypothetical protein